jgi:3-oxoadipate enol-lactonase
MSEARLAASLDGPDGAPVLVLANPLGTTRAIWAAQLPVLRKHFRVLTFELPGHGAPGARSTAPPGPYTIADLGAGVLGLMRDHDVTAAAYCGISIGGMIGLWLAANTPERISALVVCCTAISPMPSRQAWLDRAALVRSAGMTAIAEMIPPRWFTADFIARRPEAVAMVTQMLLQTDPGGYAGCAEAIAGLDLAPLAPALGAIKAPTLVLAGAEDPAAPPWQGARTALGITGSRLTVVRGTSHLAPYQTPGPVTAAILGHLRQTVG